MTTRTITDKAQLPASAPARYLNGRGYVRLRWKLGPNDYIEVYEHRLVAGLPAAGMHVHHRNRDKADNRPENLLVLTRREHALLHARKDQQVYRGKPRQPLSEYPRCREEDCENPAQCLSRSVCLKHYKRLVRRGEVQVD